MGLRLYIKMLIAVMTLNYDCASDDIRPFRQYFGLNQYSSLLVELELNRKSRTLIE